MQRAQRWKRLSSAADLTVRRRTARWSTTSTSRSRPGVRLHPRPERGRQDADAAHAGRTAREPDGGVVLDCKARPRARIDRPTLSPAGSDMLLQKSRRCIPDDGARNRADGLSSATRILAVGDRGRQRRIARGALRSMDLDEPVRSHDRRCPAASVSDSRSHACSCRIRTSCCSTSR